MTGLFRVALLAAALALSPAPAFAQSPDDGELAEFGAFMGAMLGNAFAPEPLTPEQQARLPRARALVERIVPDGTMAEMMGGMMGTMFGPMIQAGANDAVSALAEALGSTAHTVDLNEEKAAQALAIIDPAWSERRAREAELMPELMGQMIAAIEPAMKGAMAELYAIHFSDAELADIEAFFATPSGLTYARQSFAMSSDPRLAAAMLAAMPQMFAAVSRMEAQMRASTADLPPRRRFADLTKAERMRLAALTGLTEQDLSFALESAADGSAGWSQ